MPHKKEYEDQIALYALGLLEGEELREVEEHLESGCAICEGLLEDSGVVFNNLAFSLEDSPLPDNLESKIFDRLETTEDSIDRPAQSGFWRNIKPVWLNLGAAVSFALIVFLIISNLNMRSRLSSQEDTLQQLQASLGDKTEVIESMKNKLSSQEDTLQHLQARLGEETEVAEFMMNPRVEIVKLSDKMTDKKASGRLLMNPDTHQAMLIVSNVPALEEGKTYQLWIINEGKPESMGTFDVGADGNQVMEIKSMPEPVETSQFAVTLEPEGGMPHPTGDMYLLGSL
ncbi:MAG: anti-sigma factor [Deltaproteobacteria bacterium]